MKTDTKTHGKATTKLAIVDTKGQIKKIVAEGQADIAEVLAPRATPVYGKGASHRTNTTRKYQANMSLAFEKAIKKVRTENDFETDGAAIRLIFEAGLAALGFEKLVEEAQAERTEEEV